MADNPLRQATGSTAAFIWFISLFVLSLCVATIALSASQLQSRLQGLSATSNRLTVWQIERIRQDWGGQQRLVTKYRDEVDGLYADMIALQQQCDRIENDLQGFRTALTRAAAELGYKLQLYEPLLVPDNVTDLDDQNKAPSSTESSATLRTSSSQIPGKRCRLSI